LDQAFQRIIQTVDNNTGLRRLLDLPGRSFVTQIHNWTVKGRQKHHELRAFLYYLRGRQRSIWIPTFNEDAVVAATGAATDTTLDIQNIGYAYTGGVVSGRTKLVTPSGQVLTITGVGATFDPAVERLTLAGPIGEIISVGTALSFVDVARMDQDTVEITHHADTNGTCEVSSAFRSFRNSRIETPSPVDEIP
jgi:hypothetical protein